MPDAPERFKHLEILGELRGELIAAAHRQEVQRRRVGRLRGWLSRRMRAAVMAVVLVLAGGAIAVAATGVLSGSPVKQQGRPSPNAGFGLPAAGGSRLLALRVSDPRGGLPWGMRLVHTTRGEICVQVARLDGDQLGQLGMDGAFHDDGRFHPLAPDILPSESDSGDVSCIADVQIAIGSWPSSDRSAAPSPERTTFKPTSKDLRSVSWGLLGPHAVSITYHTAAGVRTRPVARKTGAYLVVSAVSHVPSWRTLGAGGVEILGTLGHEALGPLLHGTEGSVIAATFRFGSLTCSIGQGAPVTKRCPMPRPTRAAPHRPMRSLNEPVHATLRTQSHDSCSAAYLVDPCYKAEIVFKAPYAITSVASVYDVQAGSTCKHANLSSGWAIDHDVKQGETVRSQSTALFNCTSDKFKVEYRNYSVSGPAKGSQHESVIVGTAKINAP